MGQFPEKKRRVKTNEQRWVNLDERQGVNEHLKETHWKSIASVLGDVGLIYWQSYDSERRVYSENKAYLLENAITLTNHAFKLCTDLDMSKIENRQLRYSIQNNLAYYLSEKHLLGEADENERKLALDYAKYVLDNKHEHPTYAESYVDTYNFVEKICTCK